MLSFMFHMSTTINLQYLAYNCPKCLPSAHMHALSCTCHWLMDALVTDELLNAMPNCEMFSRFCRKFAIYCNHVKWRQLHSEKSNL